MRTLAGLVLCGGAGRRLGRDKAMIQFAGRPLVVHVAQTLARVADPVLLAPGTAGRLGSLGYGEVADPEGAHGPLAGLVAGLTASPHEAMAVAAVDMPFVSTDLFDLLAGLRDGEEAVIPIGPRGPEPLHGVYATSALPAMRRQLAAGHLAVREALDHLRVRYVRADEWRAVDPEARFALNVNTAAELRAVRASWPPSTEPRI